MPTYNLVEQEDAWVLHANQRVSGCQIGMDFTLILDGPAPICISICGEFIYEDGLQMTRFESTNYPSLSPTLTMIGKKVETVIAYKDGRLRVNFAEGGGVSATFSDEFEAWQVAGRSVAELLIVCGPGGCLSIWRE